MIRKSLSIALGMIIFALVGILFLLMRPTVSKIKTNQAVNPLPIIDSTAVVIAEATSRFDSPLPTPTEVPIPTVTPIPAPYPDLKVVAVEPVTTGPYLNVTWSPDGTKALLGKDYNTRHLLNNDTDVGIGSLWLLDVASNEETLLVEKVGRYCWSPDGTQIALINPANPAGIDGELLVYEIASGKATSIAQVDFLGSDYDPQWLPTNNIIFVREGGLWSIEADGSNEQRLPQFPFVSTKQQSDVVLHQAETNALLGYHFSPDGKRIAYLTRHDVQRAIAYKLWIADVDGANPRLITGQAEGSYYSWSPDSNRLLFNSYHDIDDPFLDERLDRWQGLWVVNADGSNPQPIHRVEDWGMIVSPIWFPDGSKVAFIDFQVDEIDKATDIWIADVSDKVQAGPILRENQNVIRLLWWWPDGVSLLATQTTENLVSAETMSTNRYMLGK